MPRCTRRGGTRWSEGKLRPLDDSITVEKVNRRLLGGIVVVVVLIAAIVAPNFSQRRIAGAAVPISVAGPPASGDCVTSIPDVSNLLREGNFGSGDEIDLPTAIYGPCGGRIVGEVVSVLDDAATAQRVPAPQYQDQLSQCGLDSIGYTGSVPPVVQGASGRPGIVWSPAQNFQATSVGPSRLQRRVGQRWSACIVGAPGAHLYDGSLHDVLTSGVLPSPFANCWRSNSLRDSEQVSCDHPHAVELLATTGLDNTPHTAADVQRSCSVYAGRMMRTADPGRSGALQFQILDFRDTVSLVAPSAAILQDTYITCIATAGHGVRLTGSLVGVGDGPLPTG